MGLVERLEDLKLMTAKYPKKIARNMSLAHGHRHDRQATRHQKRNDMAPARASRTVDEAKEGSGSPGRRPAARGARG